LQDYLVEVLQECFELSKLDLQQRFFQAFHENLLTKVRSYFKKELELGQLNSLANFLYNYDLKIRTFFVDERVKASWTFILKKNLEMQI